MVIKASSGRTVDKLISELSSSDDIVRDAAVARLTIIGPRAAQRLLTLARDAAASSQARVAAFRTLDAMGEPRTLDTALVAMGDGNAAVAAAATSVARSFLHTDRGVAALDRLSGTAVDPERPSEVRVAAVQALLALGSATVQPLLDALQRDEDIAVVAAAAGRIDEPAPSGFESARLLVAAATETLPDDPAALRKQIGIAGATIPVTVLHQIVERVRIREGAETGEQRQVWTAARAAAHAALAQRGSRLALYDLRETLESAKGPIAVDFVAALTAVGDVSCLEAVAAAYAQTGAGGHADWWHRGLADTFRAVVQREGLTRRHAAVKRVERRFPGLFDALTAPIHA